MATLEQMIEIAGSIENAEVIARELIERYGDAYLLDLELLLSTQGRHQEAAEINGMALSANPNDCRALYNRGWDLLRNGDLLDGYRHLRHGRLIGVYAKPDIRTNRPVWDGESDIDGKTILFHCESGLGDEIIQVRFVRELIECGAKVVIGCSASLMSIFSRIQGVSAVVDKEVSGAVYHDYWIPSMNAVDIIGITYETLSGKPYLTAMPEYVEKWSKIINPRGYIRQLNIGIRWAGNVCYEKELYRTLPVYDLIEAVHLPGVDIYSLQRDDNRVDLPPYVVDLADQLDTWEDTAGAMMNLDLVISGCTSVPHMSAALGVPTWVIISTSPYYQWALPGDRTPWYDTARIFRQEKFQDWTAPLQAVRKALLRETQCRVRT